MPRHSKVMPIDSNKGLDSNLAFTSMIQSALEVNIKNHANAKSGKTDRNQNATNFKNRNRVHVKCRGYMRWKGDNPSEYMKSLLPKLNPKPPEGQNKFESSKGLIEFHDTFEPTKPARPPNLMKKSSSNSAAIGSKSRSHKGNFSNKAEIVQGYDDERISALLNERLASQTDSKMKDIADYKCDLSRKITSDEKIYDSKEKLKSSSSIIKSDSKEIESKRIDSFTLHRSKSRERERERESECNEIIKIPSFDQLNSRVLFTSHSKKSEEGDKENVLKEKNALSIYTQNLLDGNTNERIQSWITDAKKGESNLIVNPPLDPPPPVFQLKIESASEFFAETKEETKEETNSDLMLQGIHYSNSANSKGHENSNIAASCNDDSLQSLQNPQIVPVEQLSLNVPPIIKPRTKFFLKEESLCKDICQTNCSVNQFNENPSEALVIVEFDDSTTDLKSSRLKKKNSILRLISRIKRLDKV